MGCQRVFSKVPNSEFHISRGQIRAQVKNKIAPSASKKNNMLQLAMLS